MPSAVPVAMRQARPRAMANAISDSAKAMPSHTGGGGTRQCGSMLACHATMPREMPSSHPASFATHTHPVKTATNAMGTATPRIGTMNALAERPESPMRWK